MRAEHPEQIWESLDLVPEAVVAASPEDGTVLFVNLAATRDYGWPDPSKGGGPATTVDRLISLPIGGLLPRLHAADATRTRAEVLTGPGRAVPVRVTASTAECAGSPLTVLVVTDLSHEMEQVRHLRESEMRFRVLVDENFDVYYDWNIVTGENDFSTQLDRLLGYPPTRFPRTFEAWRDHLHPSERARVLARVTESAEAGTPYRDEYRLRRQDGSYITVSDHGQVTTDGEGRPAHMIGAIRDVTLEREAHRALRESEELYHTLFSRSTNPALQVDPEGRIVDANDAATLLLELEGDPSDHRTLYDHFPDDVVRRLLQTGVEEDESPIIESDVKVGGVSRTLIVSSVPCDVGGRSTIFVLGTDITSRRLLTKALEDRNTALRVILEQRDQDRIELEERVRANVERLVDPTLDRLARATRGRPEAAHVDALRENLGEIVKPFGRRLAGHVPGTRPLSRREIEVANLVRLGKTTDEIADALHVSASAVKFHRGNIRRKLGIEAGGPHLAAFLTQLGEV